ncbi:hypothetical protein ABZ372_41845, partial [Streptomyces sp. NPDC005921]
ALKTARTFYDPLVYRRIRTFTLAVALPVSVLGAWLFAKVFETPFKRNRSWKSLLAPGSFRGEPTV